MQRRLFGTQTQEQAKYIHYTMYIYNMDNINIAHSCVVITADHNRGIRESS